MQDWPTIAAFVGVSVMLTLAPGPDIIFLIAQGATRGRKAGVTTAMGLATGCLVHTTAAALGVSAIFRASSVAFHVLKFGGVGYLLYLAYKTWRARQEQADGGPGGAQPLPQSESLYARGFLMNILNPKVALFFLAFLPQFADPDPARGPVWAQMVLLGVLFTGQVVVVFGSIGLFSGEVHRRLAGNAGAKAGTVLSYAIIGVYLLLAARLALAEM